MTSHTLFNRKLIDMLEDLASSFPMVPEFAMAITPPARMLLNMDPKQGQRMFNEYVALPYESHILARDEAFLLAREDFGPCGANVNGDIVIMIKSVWRGASPADREAIWQHLHVLILLNRRCLA